MFSDVRRNVGMVLVLLLVVTIIYCFVSPAPRSLLIRLLFDKDARMKREAMAEALSDMGVSVTTLFYEDVHLPIHEYENQFILDADGFENFETMISYIHQKLNE